MGQRDYLSDGDIEVLQYMYGTGFGACYVRILLAGHGKQLRRVLARLDSTCDGVICDADGISLPSEFPTIGWPSIRRRMVGKSALPGHLHRRWCGGGRLPGQGACGCLDQRPRSDGVRRWRPVVLLTTGEDEGTVLEGFTVRNGFASIGGGIR